MEYIFNIIENSFESNLISAISSIILFFLVNFAFHIYLNITQKNKAEIFWPSIIQSMRNYILNIVAINFIISLFLIALNLHMIQFQSDYHLLFALQLFLGRILSLLLLCAGAFFYMKNSDIAKSIYNKNRTVICLIFCMPYFYIKYQLHGINYIIGLFFK